MRTHNSAIGVLVEAGFPFDWSLTGVAISHGLAERLAICWQAERREGSTEEWLDAIAAEVEVQ